MNNNEWLKSEIARLELALQWQKERAEKAEAIFDAHGPERNVQREIDSLLREEPAKPKFVFDYPDEVQTAYWWIKTYCRHHATLGIDQQCLDGMPSLPSDNTPYTPDQQTARQHLAILREAGLLMESGFFKHNFVVRDL